MNQYASSVLRLRRIATVVAFVGGLGSTLGWFTTRQEFFASYLVSYLFWLTIPLGCLALLMLHQLTGGAWGVAARPFLRPAVRTLPLLALLFVPIVLGAPDLYPWTAPGFEVEGGRLAYLDLSAFILRAVGYFAIWTGFAWISSRRRDQEVPRQGLAGAGLLVLTMASSFAAIDWLMSLEPHWSSSIYGLYFLVGQAIAAISFLILAAHWLSPKGEDDAIASTNYVHDWGKLLLAFVMIWAYFGLSQFLIIWMSDLPEEVTWYVSRSDHGWQGVTLILVFLHFVLPFALLLSRPLKTRLDSLVWVALLLLAAHWLDLYYQAGPAFDRSPGLKLTDLSTLLFVGGALIALFSEMLHSDLLPHNEKSIEEASHG